MPERNIGLEILEGIREIKANKAGEIDLKTRKSVPSTNNEPKFDLWLEIEIGSPNEPANRPTENFCNIQVTLDDNRTYALNVWTFDFLPLARYPWPYEIDTSAELEKYLLPPDLFVERLDRPTIEAVIRELLANNEMKNEWLCSSQDS